jgi:hypothetical protein
VATGYNDAIALARERKSCRTPDTRQPAGDQNNGGVHPATPSNLPDLSTTAVPARTGVARTDGGALIGPSRDKWVSLVPLRKTL